MRPSPARVSQLPAQIALVVVWACGCFTDPGQPATATSGDTAEDPSTGEPTGGPSGCGDAQLDPGEECDYGELNNGEQGTLCRADCRKNVCGDGYVAVTEGCDDGNMVDGDGCSNACELTACGDGVLGPGEACDDGNMVDDDACSNLCKPPVCGDGNLNAGEACDDGAGNGDDQSCTLTCVPAVCGDGLVHVGVELCDDGNDIDDDMCSNACMAPACGDGVVQDGEACDDGNNVDDDGCSRCQTSCGNGIVEGNEACDDGNNVDSDNCSAQCERLGLTVFVTAAKFPASLGGLAEADARCNVYATAAHLPGAGTYLAWLSDLKSAPNQRFSQSALPYLRLDGVKIANDWNGLTSGKLLAPIDVSEQGVKLNSGNGCASLDGVVWTNTTATGFAGMDDCNAWSTKNGQGGVGLLGAVNSDWTAACEISCVLSARLYCFEQP